MNELYPVEKCEVIWGGIKTMAFGFENGKIAVGFRMQVLDVEEYEGEWEGFGFLKNLSEELKIRFYYVAENAGGVKKGEGNARKNSIEELGYVKQKVFVFVERSFRGSFFSVWKKIKKFKEGFLKEEAQSIMNSLGTFMELGKFHAFEDEDYYEIFPEMPNNKKFNVRGSHLDLGEKVLGVVRLFKLSTYPVNQMSLALVKDLLPKPYKIALSLKKKSQAGSEIFAARKSKQNESATNMIAASKYLEAEELHQRVSLAGLGLVEMEFQIILERQTEKEIKEAASQMIRNLKPMGEFYFEGFGCFPSFLASLPGQDFHVTLVEKEDVAPCFYPILSFGKSENVLSKSGLLLHRLDDSVDSVDIFASLHDSYSVLILGLPGTGKSVLTNLLTRSLFFEGHKIIKIDVGGSHSKETALLGGKEFTLSLDKPSGINPFSILKNQDYSPDVVQILSTFVEVLLLEDGENKLSKTLKTELEKAVLDYSKSSPKNPSLNDFYEKQDFPRKNLLSRWVTGIYKNAFVESGESFQNRLSYYNFSNLEQAADKDFAQAGLAAVMAVYNFALFQNRKKGERIIFIADETPFFIEKCFPFFSLSIANVRKFGHSFITVAQNTKQVIVGGDDTILQNSYHKFLFSVDTEKSVFKERLKLEDNDIEKIMSLKRVQGEYSEVFYKTPKTSKTFSIRLTGEEYFQTTTKKEDKQKIEELSKFCPTLTLNEIIKCITHLCWVVVFLFPKTGFCILDYLADYGKEISQVEAYLSATDGLLTEINSDESEVGAALEKLHQHQREISKFNNFTGDTKSVLLGPRYSSQRLDQNIRRTSEYVRRTKRFLKHAVVLGHGGNQAINTHETNSSLNEIQKNQQVIILQNEEQKLSQISKEQKEQMQWRTFIAEQRELRRSE